MITHGELIETLRQAVEIQIEATHLANGSVKLQVSLVTKNASIGRRGNVTRAAGDIITTSETWIELPDRGTE
jgi:hypothetical protein